MNLHVLMLEPRPADRSTAAWAAMTRWPAASRSCASVVAGAALVIVAVFSAFALGSDRMRQADRHRPGQRRILIDATMIREYLFPAGVELLGAWNSCLQKRPSARCRRSRAGRHRVDGTDQITRSVYPAASSDPT